MAQVVYGVKDETEKPEVPSDGPVSDEVIVDNLNFAELEQASVDRLLPPGYEISKSLRNTPMPKLSNSRLGQILTRFYTESMGGSENLDKLNSIRMDSIYKTLDGEFKFESISKKPNKLKVTIANKAGKLVIAYNGSDAWQKDTGSDLPQIIRDEHQLRRLAIDAQFSSHLLYPFQKGKAYEYLGVLRESDRICHLIRVHTQEQFILDYYIDVENFFEVKLLQVDKLGHFKETELYYSDHELVEGIPFAHRIETFVDGEWNSLLNVKSVELNKGLFNWMFDVESGDFPEKRLKN